MRIARLDLERYGAFSDTVIAFPEAKRMTLVFGANEAGKTTALNAVVDLLYGIEVRSSFGFLHGNKAMSVAGRLVAADGRSVAVRRVKRQHRTLLDFDTDVPLPDDALAPLLDGRARAAFLDGFALDRDRLRAGGRRLLEHGGSLAESLVAAAPGLGDVLAARNRWVEEAATFHNHARKTASTDLQRALTARDAARKAMRELEVRAEAVSRVRQAAADADRARAEATEAEAAARMEVARLDRLQQAAREIAAYDLLRASRDALGMLPEVTAHSLRSARATLQTLAEAQACHVACEAETRAAESALASIAIDARLIGAGAAIETIEERRIVVAAGLADLAKRQDELTSMRGSLAGIARSLGLADADEVRSCLPDDATLTRAERLVARMADVEREGRDVAVVRTRLAEARGRIEVALGRLGDPPDPAALRHRLDELDGCEGRATAAKKARRAAEDERRRLDGIAAGVRLGASSLEGLAALVLPSHVRTTFLAKALDAAERDRAAAGSAAAALADEKRRLEARLAAIKAPGEIPTGATVEAARRARDEAWRRARPALAGERPVTATDAEDAVALDLSMPHCDALADERWTESTRAAELRQAEVAIADLDARIQAAVQAEGQCRDTVLACRSSWTDATGHLAAGMAERGDLLERLRAAHEAVSHRERLLALERDAEERVAESDDDGRRVESLGRELGLDPSDATVSRLRVAVAALQARFHERRDGERDLANNDEASSVLKAREAALAKERTAVEAEVSDLLPRLAIRPQATSAEAGAALAAWRDAKALLPSMAQSERRVVRIKEDRDEFVRLAEALLCDVAPDALGQDPFVAIRQIRSRLDRERNLLARSEDARANLVARVSAAERARETLAERAASETALRGSLGIDASTSIEPLLDTLAEAAAIDADVRRARLRLDEALAGRPEHLVRAEVGDSDPVAIVGRRSMAESNAAEASGEVARAIERHVTCRSALAEVEARGGAAAAVQDEQDANAAVAAAAEGFVRSHAAARLLSHAIDRYRERHQSPVVARASAHFSLLTDDRWSGLAVDYGEETPTIKPVRDGKPEGLHALSEGTCDQLFLALRVATIEEHALTAAAMPFVADDLFVAFDERRTEAGLRLLGKLGATTQVVMFTHHWHVVESATSVLGDAIEVVRL